MRYQIELIFPSTIGGRITAAPPRFDKAAAFRLVVSEPQDGSTRSDPSQTLSGPDFCGRDGAAEALGPTARWERL